MFSKKAVFVVGAGCSMEFKFPSGYELRKNISMALYQEFSKFLESPIGAACMNSGAFSNIDILRSYVLLLRDGVMTRPSIDQYLDFHRDDKALIVLGKLMIVDEILKCEFNLNRTNIMADGKWIEPLFHAMGDGCTKATVGKLFENVSFICFNYDRIIEHYFKLAVTNLLGAVEADAKVGNALSGLHVIHPYGSLGDVPFGARASAQTLLQMANSLKVFTEKMEDMSGVMQMRAMLSEAEKIVFIGVGYQEQNMELLSLQGVGAIGPKKIYGTVNGMSDAATRIAKSDIYRHLNPNHGNNIELLTYPNTASMFMKAFAGELHR